MRASKASASRRSSRSRLSMCRQLQHTANLARTKEPINTPYRARWNQAHPHRRHLFALEGDVGVVHLEALAQEARRVGTSAQGGLEVGEGGGARQLDLAG